MMHIMVERVLSDDDATLSFVYVNGKFECFGLEDEYRETKVPGETRIPAGFYNVGVRHFGGHHERYQRNYAWHDGMLEVLDVEGFTDILIHKGNTDEDTAGCLLVGKDCSTSGELKVLNSKGAYEDLYTKVIQEAKAGLLTIEYRDLDR